jgi:hypothetical protein
VLEAVEPAKEMAEKTPAKVQLLFAHDCVCVSDAEVV